MDAVEEVLRWERAGGTWRVLSRSDDGGLTLALDTCHGEEMSRLTSEDAALVAHVGGRWSSDG